MMDEKQYKAFQDRWLDDLGLTITVFRISDVAAVLLLIGDRLVEMAKYFIEQEKRREEQRSTITAKLKKSKLLPKPRKTRKGRKADAVLKENKS